MRVVTRNNIGESNAVTIRHLVWVGGLYGFLELLEELFALKRYAELK